jgi:hypothetical protein
MPGANVFAYDGTAYKPTDRAQSAGIFARGASLSGVIYVYQLSKPAASTVATQIWQGFPPTPSQVTFSHSTTGTAPNSTNRTTISWTCDSSALLSKFEIYQKVGTGSFVALSTTIGSGTRSYTVDSHAAGTLYTYYVRAVGISGLTKNGAENSFTLSAPTLTGVSLAEQSKTSSSATWRITVPAGTFQKVDWYLSTDNTTFTFSSSATIGSSATFADFTWSSLSERTTRYVRAVLTNYSNHATSNTASVGITTLNQPPGAPSISSVSAVSESDPGIGGGYATTGEVRKRVNVTYSLAGDSDYKEHTLYVYGDNGYGTGPSGYVTEITRTDNANRTETVTGLMPSTRYWFLLRQRDNNSGETDNSQGWQTAVTEQIWTRSQENAYTSYSAGGEVNDTRDGNYLVDSVTTIPNENSYSAASQMWDNNLSNFWLSGTNSTVGSPDPGSVVRIRFECSDLYYDYWDYYIRGVNFYLPRSHNTAIQVRAGTAGSWLGTAVNSSITGNSDPYLYDAVSPSSGEEDVNWSVYVGVGDPTFRVHNGGSSGGSAKFAFRFCLRNMTSAYGGTVLRAGFSEFNFVYIRYRVRNSTYNAATNRYY